MFFNTKQAARYYVNSHAPEFRHKLAIVPCKKVCVLGDDSDDCKPSDVQFAETKGYTVALK